MNKAEIWLTNSLSGEKEKFAPVREGEVKMYHCGPTVYDDVHIGNLRSFLLADIVRRVFEMNEYKVTQVMNITDIGHLSGDGDDGEDKMTKGLKREGKPLTMVAMQELADYYTGRSERDLARMNIEAPHHLPKASRHIKEDIGLIETLEKKGFAYKTSDGVYFDTSKSADYGKLGGLNKEEKEMVARVEGNSEKKNVRDFALWKLNPELGYESPWGKGFPGWHIECSAMSMKYLGEHFDIHTGGVDLAPIHHNNEIAQSECATGEPFVSYWLHSAFVNIDGNKMAKSVGNFFKLADITDKGYSPLSYRYFLLGAHYSKPVNFSWDALDGAVNALEKLETRMSELGDKVGKVDTEYVARFVETVNDDLNTPVGLSFVWEVLGNTNMENADKKATILKFDEVLGLGLDRPIATQTIPQEVLALVEERKKARAEKRWQDADGIREKIEKMGFTVKDTKDGDVVVAM